MRIIILCMFMLSLLVSCGNNNDKGKEAEASLYLLGPRLCANDWTNESARQKYLEVALSICNTYSPAYIELAVEANTYYHYHPEDFDRFVALYKDIYVALKGTTGCRDAKIYVTFQLERMKGLGTAVGFSGNDQWSILDTFEDKLDLIAFTTYPEIEYANPGALPADYYTGITAHIPPALAEKKIAFTEMGWNSDTIFTVTGTTNTYQTQADFITRFALLTDSLKNAGKLEFVTWTFMYDFKDTGTFDPFRTIGLLNFDGTAKDTGNTVWNGWISFRNAVAMFYPTGIGPIPKNFPDSSSEDWIEFYQKVPDVASLLLVQTEWRDSPLLAGHVPRLFADIYAAKTYHHADLIYGINFFDLSNGNAYISK